MCGWNTLKINRRRVKAILMSLMFENFVIIFFPLGSDVWKAFAANNEELSLLILLC